MPVRDELGKRMKKYESVSKTVLMRRTPVIIRIDGKAFHTFTRGFEKPFDKVLIKTMQETTKYLCENIQGCVFGYTQSDEISLVLIDYQTLTTDAWFDYEVQKLCSVAASMATMVFNKFFRKNVESWWTAPFVGITKECQDRESLYHIYQIALDKGAMFDARAFNIPKEEVTNCIYWRQLDATRNSIQMVGQAYFSKNELHKKTCNQIQDMLHEQKGINWNDYRSYLKRGTAIVKTEIDKAEDEYNTLPHIKWIIDLDMPQLKGDDRVYLDKLIDVGA